MNETQIHRYARHISLSSIGFRGQQRLLAATIGLEVSANPASHCALAYLAASGVGRIAISADDEPVSAQEVAASLLLTGADVGAPRFEAMRRHIAALNSDVKVVRASSEDALLSLPAAASLAHGLAAGCALAAERVDAIARGDQ